MAHATLDSKYFVIALNIPEVLAPMIGNISVSVCADGRFGYADPLNWPQVYCAHRPWQALIPKRPGPSSLLRAVWESPTLGDFVPAEVEKTSPSPFGYLSSAILARLETAKDLLATEVDSALASQDVDTTLQETIRTSWSATNNALITFDVPSTFRDLVRQFAHFHRCWAECAAVVTWATRVKRRYEVAVVNIASGASGDGNLEIASDIGGLEPGLAHDGVMGVFCSDRLVAARMMAAGVPVWFLQLKAGTSQHLFGGREEVAMVKASKKVVDEEGIGRASAYASQRRASDNAEQPRAQDTSTLTLAPQGCTKHAGEEHVNAIWEQSARIVDAEVTPFPDNFGEDETGQLEPEPNLRTVRLTSKIGEY